MSRMKSSMLFSGFLEVEAQAPLDARLVAKTKEELLDADSYPYAYVGMIVSVESEEKAYMLIADDTTDETSWKEIGSGSSGTYDYLFSWDATSRSLVLNEGTDDEQKLRLSGLAASSDLPTKVSELTNDLKFQTDTEVAATIASEIADKVDLTDYYTKSQTDSIIANLNSLDLVTVTSLPTENIRTDCIYLLNDSTETGNLYSEYVYIEGEGWEKFGTAQIDLSNYYTKSEVDAAIEASGSSSGQSATDTEVNQIISNVFGDSSGSDPGNDPGFDPNEP